MSAALQQVLDGTVDVQSFISWFCQKTSKDTPSPLPMHNHLRDAFVPYFLGYVREQSADALGLHNSGLTPRKGFAKTDPQPAGSTAEPKIREEPVSRTRLQFQAKSSHVTLERPFDVIDTNAPHLNSAASNNRGARSGPPHRWNEGPELKSRQKMSLGQFIGGDTSARSSPAVQVKSGGRHVKLVSTNRSHKNAAGTLANGPIDLDDMEAFPAVAITLLNGKRNPVSRRITPTPVANKSMRLPGTLPVTSSHECLQVVNRDIFFNETTTDSSQGSLQHERSLLREERDRRAPLTCSNRLVSSSTSSSYAPESVRDVSCACPSAGAVYADARRTQVTFESQLSCLAKIYSACIDENLLQCLSVELHFTVQLLTAQVPPENYSPPPETETQYLSSVANCIYFAVHVLWLQRRVVSFLDAATLKALRDNRRVVEFSPKLHTFLAELCTGAMGLPLSSAAREAATLPTTIVAFQTDTDDRDNFVTENTFHVFRKKRDVFYEIMRDWQENYSTPNWSVASKLGERIRLLVTTDCDAFLHAHLARLFQAQLVLTCRGTCLGERQSEEDPELLELLRESNPEKYERLRERLVTPNQSLGGPCPPPHFRGQQEFFKSFLDHAGSPGFIQHLTNVLCARIRELNATQLDLREDDGDAEVDGRTRDQFRQCLLTLRLLAKFLGYVVFSPYRAGDSLPERILAAQVTVRDVMTPLVDVLGFLRDAIRLGRSVLVVPWLTEFLAMMDTVAPYLTYYRTVLNLLHELYGKLRCNAVSTLGDFFLRLLLGWLFEVVNCPFPGEFSVNVDSVDVERLSLSPRSLDQLAVVDLETLYGCCPYLNELPALLSRFAIGVSSRSNPLRRKITPVSTGRKPATSTATTALQLQQQMEESFFHNQPDSLRKTVDFTVERLSSKVIKHVRRHLMVEARQWGLDEVVRLRLSLDGGGSPGAFQKAKIVAYKKVSEAAVIVAEKIKWETGEYCKRVCPEEASKILPLLLPDDTSQAVLNMCVKFARRSCSAKVSQWLSTQVDADNFRKDLVHEMQKLLKLSPQGKPVVEDVAKTDDTYYFVPPAAHDGDAPSPVDALYLTKCMLKDLYEDDHPIVWDDVSNVLATVSGSLQKRKDLTEPALKIMIRMTAEIAVAIVIRRPQLCGEMFLSEFLNLWRAYPAQWSVGVLPAIFSLRSYKYMSVASDSLELSWSNMELLTSAILNSQVGSTQTIDELCVKLFQHNWENEFRHGLVRCFRNLLVSFGSAVADDVNVLLPLISGCLSAEACI